MARELPANDPNRDKNQSKANNIKQILNGIINPAPPEIWLKLMYGVEVIALTPQLAKAFAAPGGVLISTLTPSGKAAQAGLKVGDIIVKVGEDAVADPASFMQALSQNTSDERELLIVRAGETLPLNLPK
jgi:S1-C subfamily serine protease